MIPQEAIDIVDKIFGAVEAQQPQLETQARQLARLQDKTRGLERRLRLYIDFAHKLGERLKVAKRHATIFAEWADKNEADSCELGAINARIPEPDRLLNALLMLWKDAEHTYHTSPVGSSSWEVTVGVQYRLTRQLLRAAGLNPDNLDAYGNPLPMPMPTELMAEQKQGPLDRMPGFKPFVAASTQKAQRSCLNCVHCDYDCYCPVAHQLTVPGQGENCSAFRAKGCAVS